jgi:hypothetical protein
MAAQGTIESKSSNEIKDLLPLLDKRGLECLNQDSKHPISHAVEEVRKIKINIFEFVGNDAF